MNNEHISRTMDGKLINNINEKWIKPFWLGDIQADGRHIDEILSFIPPKGLWVKNAFACFDNIHAIANKYEGIMVELCFYLNNTKSPRPFPSRLNRQMFNNIDTPPEIFLIKNLPDFINCNGIVKECGTLYGMNCEYHEIQDEIDHTYWHYLYFANSTSNIISLKNILNQIN